MVKKKYLLNKVMTARRVCTALRFVYDDFESAYEDLLDKANIPSLHIKRLRTMAVETFPYFEWYISFCVVRSG